MGIKLKEFNMKKIMSVSLIILLTTCAPITFYRATTSQGEFNRDDAGCTMTARFINPPNADWAPAYYYGRPSTGDAIALLTLGVLANVGQAVNTRDTYRACMVSLGYLTRD
jgi:hypothetical protein